MAPKKSKNGKNDDFYIILMNNSSKRNGDRNKKMKFWIMKQKLCLMFLKVIDVFFTLINDAKWLLFHHENNAKMMKIISWFWFIQRKPKSSNENDFDLAKFLGPDLHWHFLGREWTKSQRYAWSHVPCVNIRLELAIGSGWVGSTVLTVSRCHLVFYHISHLLFDKRTWKGLVERGCMQCTHSRSISLSFLC